MNNIVAKLPVADLGGNLVKPSQLSDTPVEKSRWFSSMLTALMDEETSRNVNLSAAGSEDDSSDDEVLELVYQEVDPAEGLSGANASEVQEQRDDESTSVSVNAAFPTDNALSDEHIPNAEDLKDVAISDRTQALNLQPSPGDAVRMVGDFPADVSSGEVESSHTVQRILVQPAEPIKSQVNNAQLNSTDVVDVDGVSGNNSSGTDSSGLNKVVDTGLASANQNNSNTGTVPDAAPAVQASADATAAINTPVDAATQKTAKTGEPLHSDPVTTAAAHSVSSASNLAASANGVPVIDQHISDTGTLSPSTGTVDNLKDILSTTVATDGKPVMASPKTLPNPEAAPSAKALASERVAQMQQSAPPAEISFEEVLDPEFQTALKSAVQQSERHTQPGTDRSPTETSRPDATATVAQANDASSGGLAFGQNASGVQIPELLANPTQIDAKDVESWKEAVQTTGLEVLRSAETATDGFSRLSQIAVPNMMLRRELLPALQQMVKQVADAAKTSPEIWQKHNFVMDDGQRVDVMVRQVEGVMHLKLSASNPELSRLLEEYARDIEEHLKETLAIEIDLQFGKGADEGASLAAAFGDKKGKSPYQNGLSDLLKSREINVKPQQVQSVRYFGYNRNEWTA